MTACENNKKDNTPNHLETLAIGQTTSGSALTLDVEYFQSLLDDSDAPEAEKRKLIEELWSIIVGFVDLGFGIHPVQQANPTRSELANDSIAKLIADIGQEHLNEPNKNTKENTNPERYEV